MLSLINSNSEPAVKHPKIAIRSHKGLRILDAENILYLEGCGRYTKIYLTEGKPVTATKTLKTFETILPSHFCRIHKSHFVNIFCIREVRAGVRSSIELKNGVQLDVAKRRKSVLLKKLSAMMNEEGSKLKAEAG